jgi:hypothetical protein
VGVVAGNHSEVGDRFDQHKVVWMPFKHRGKRRKPDTQHVLVLVTGRLFHPGKFVSNLEHFSDARNYHILFIYQVQSLFVGTNHLQKTNNPFPGVIFKYALQYLVQPVNIHTMIYITTCIGIGEI